MHRSCAKWHEAFNSFIRLTAPALIIFCHVVHEIFIHVAPQHFPLLRLAFQAVPGLLPFCLSVNPQAALKASSRYTRRGTRRGKENDGRDWGSPQTWHKINPRQVLVRLNKGLSTSLNSRHLQDSRRLRLHFCYRELVKQGRPEDWRWLPPVSRRTDTGGRLPSSVVLRYPAAFATPWMLV